LGRFFVDFKVTQYGVVLQGLNDIAILHFVGTGELFSSVDTNGTGTADRGTASGAKCERGILGSLDVCERFEKGGLFIRKGVFLMGVCLAS
jgi:hypothetical protein